MATLSDYWQTIKDLGYGKTSIKGAIDAGLDTKGGILDYGRMTGKVSNPYASLLSGGSSQPTAQLTQQPSATRGTPGSFPQIGTVTRSAPTSGTGNKQTSSGSSGGSSSGSSSQDAWEKKMKKSISAQFEDVLGMYKNQINELPGQQQQLISGVEGMAGTQKATISSALGNILAQLSGQREDVGTMQKRTLQDLADNTRNLFQAGNVYLGTRGAGDSSATGMYSAALTQHANKERAGVQRSADDMRKDIGMKEADVQTDFQSQMNEVDTWKQTQTQNIVMQYTDLKRQLENARANAKGMEKEALRKLETDLYNNAQQQLTNIQNSAAQVMQGLNQGIAGGQELGQRGVDSLQQSGQYQVGQVYQPGEVDLSGLQDVGYGNQATYDSLTGGFWKVNEDGSAEWLGTSTNFMN